MSHKVSSCEVLVAGGGIIGAACARALALRGLRVLICEPGPDPAAASAASAGILGPQIEPNDQTLRGPGPPRPPPYSDLFPPAPAAPRHDYPGRPPVGLAPP